MDFKKILIILAIIILIIICVFSFGLIQDNNDILTIDGTNDTSNWRVSPNVTVMYSSLGTHFKGEGNGTDECILVIGGNTHGFNGSKDLTIEFDLKNNNSMQLCYLNNDGVRKGIVYSNNFTKFNHWKFEYKSSEHKIIYSMNNKTLSSVKTPNTATIGFQLIDWQGDMDCTIKNITIKSGT